MMKSKKMTYVLVGVVALVWGLIVFKVWGEVWNQDDAVIGTSGPKEALFVRTGHRLDTFSLELDYPDPFNRSLIDADVAVLKEPLVHRPPMAAVLNSQPKPRVDWNGVRYLGYIKGLGAKKGFALLALRELEFSLAEGQSAHGIVLKKLTTDSVLLVYSKEQRYVKIN